MKTTENPATARFVKILVFAISAVVCDLAGRRSAATSSTAHLVLVFAALTFGIAAAVQLKQGIIAFKQNRP